MNRPTASPSPRTPAVAIAAAALALLSLLPARADAPQGRIKNDITVGANHDVPLKANQLVQVMKDDGAKAVIMVQLPDGSSGIYQIDAAEVDLIAPPPAATPPPPSPQPIAPPPHRPLPPRR